MKRFVLTVLLALALPSAALANTVTIDNNNGTLVASTSGLSLVSDITGIFGGYGSPHGSDIGTFSLTLGPLLTGSLQTGGTFGYGGTYSLSVNPGVIPRFPQGTTLFTGYFTYCPACNGRLGYGPVTWTLLSPGTYMLEGYVTGYWRNGWEGYGLVKEVYTGSFSANGVFTATSGSGFSLVTPEPSTAGLFLTGLVGVAGILRKKLRV